MPPYGLFFWLPLAPLRFQDFLSQMPLQALPKHKPPSRDCSPWLQLFKKKEIGCVFTYLWTDGILMKQGWWAQILRYKLVLKYFFYKNTEHIFGFAVYIQPMRCATILIILINSNNDKKKEKITHCSWFVSLFAWIIPLIIWSIKFHV